MRSTRQLSSASPRSRSAALASCSCSSDSRFAALAPLRLRARSRASYENLNYRASALKDNWPYYKAHPDEADGARAPIPRRSPTISTAAARILATGRSRAATAGFSGGRGFMQVTGRYNYKTLTTEYKKLFGDSADFEADPDLMARFPYDIRSAVCFRVWKKLPARADKGATDAVVDSVTDVVNMKTPSRAARKSNFKEAYDVFK